MLPFTLRGSRQRAGAKGRGHGQGTSLGRAVRDWQPIEATPKDGTIVLGCSGTGDEYQVYEMARKLHRSSVAIC
jgi:hypothetical protein